MKYSYAYKTGDGVRHEDSMEAESREAVFAALRKRGIKAIKVVAADGSKANGEIRGVRKRVLAASVAVTALAVGLLAYFLASSAGDGVPSSAAKPLPRQEIHGDRSRITGAADSLFTTRAERFLARFAEPGRPFVAPESDWPGKSEFEAVLGTPLAVAENEFTEHIDLKRMVEWIKREMRAYLKGGGYVSGYIRELIRRQQAEIDERAKQAKTLSELLMKSPVDEARGRRDAREAAYTHWLRANARLQSMGIHPLPLPDLLRVYQLGGGKED